MCLNSDVLKYESDIWNTCDILRGLGIKQSHTPDYMMPFFSLVMIESRLLREKARLLSEGFTLEDVVGEIQDEERGYNEKIVVDNETLASLVLTDRDFEFRFQQYLDAWDPETKELLGIESKDSKEFMDIQKYVGKLVADDALFAYVSAWAKVDLKDYDNSDITTLEEHIKRRWADISAETAGEQYTPDDVIDLISDIISTKLDSNSQDKFKTIYDMTCGGGNMLFGVEDKLVKKSPGVSFGTYGQEISEPLYALAKIESRFRPLSDIQRGCTLTNDRFPDRQFDFLVANPPYGVDWKRQKKMVEQDTTGRYPFKGISVSDGQLLFMQHAMAKLNDNGFGVVVHNGSPMFSGDVNSAESQVRKWLLDNDYVEAWIQLPKEEFFNTQITTYLWVLNKNKPAERKDRILLINAADRFSKLKKSKGVKTNFMDKEHRQWVTERFNAFEDFGDEVKVLSKYDFYYNKQQLTLIHANDDGRSFYEISPKGQKVNIDRLSLNGEHVDLSQFEATPEGLEAAKQALAVTEGTIEVAFTLKGDSSVCVQSDDEFCPDLILDGENLGAGRIQPKVTLQKATKKQKAALKFVAEIKPILEKDYEIIPFLPDPEENQAGIQAFIDQWVRKQYILGENSVGVEVNFNKIFYKPVVLRSTAEISKEIESLDLEISRLSGQLWN